MLGLVIGIPFVFMYGEEGKLPWLAAGVKEAAPGPKFEGDCGIPPEL